ncbi:MAG TPA: 2-dehydropantoate 2-reductase N-terminal domain-containing protein, partial [Methanoculleus sp.]|nr:2-dehydropantoate 2-reductase N-terminal domain-containing protein [Methanoculleus sp.]
MEPLQQPTVLILGAGAVGLSLAGKLHGVATVCVACRQVHANAIVERGLVMEG